MAHTKWVVAAATVFAALSGGTAQAQQQPEVLEMEYRVPRRSFEVGVGAGYSQGTGQIVDVGERVSDIARAGGEAQLDLGYRINENWFVGGYGSYGRFRDGSTSPTDSSVWGLTAGGQAQYHFMPLRRWDPWISMGAGYRGIFQKTDAVGTESRHGIQLLRFRFGLDLRASPGVALGPQVGIDATMFTAENHVGTSGFEKIDGDNRTISTFFFAGLGGRFDFNTEHVRRDAYTTAWNY